MTLTKELIEERLRQLQEKYKALEADAIAVNGAVQDCQYWLSVLAQEKKEQKRKDD